MVDDDTEKANLFNDYFGSVFEPDSTANLKVTPEKVKPLSFLKFPPELVYFHLCSLPAKLSAGPDGLPSLFFRKLAFQLAEPLSSIFEVSFHTGTVPSDWSKSLVTPIYKKGCRSNPANYRPVSLTCVACRLMEKIIKTELLAHFSRNSLISNSQHGFLARHSTVTQLLESLNDWTSAVDQRDAVDVIFADVSKAFDKLPHSKILESLKAYRIEGLLLQWVKVFLSNRTQCVVYNGCQSPQVRAISGVPQGSVLGPLCFLVVINRLPSVIRHGTVKLFADDCKIYLRIKSDVDFNLLHQDLHSLFEWAQQNGLVLALEKTVVMHLGNNNPNRKYRVNDTELNETCVTKDLGVIFSSNLKCADHIGSICKKAFARVNLIYIAFYSRQLSFLVQMFKTYVRPTLEYASEVWSPHLKKDIDLIERVQKYFTQRLPGVSGNYTDRLFLLRSKGIQLELLEMRRIMADLITVYKIINGLCALDFRDFFQWSSATMVRGHCLRLQVPWARLDCRRYFFANRVVIPWNALKPETVSAPCLKLFKMQLTTVERPKLLTFLKGSVQNTLNGCG